MDNIGIFIDGSNMFYAQKSNDWELDYKKIYNYCGQSGNVTVAKYFVAFPYYLDTESIGNYRKFRSALINIGFTVRDKEIKIRKIRYWNITIDETPLDEFMRDETGSKTVIDGKICIKKDFKRDYKGNLDIEMAIGMVTECNQYDKCFLFSGDSDFIPVARYLRQNNKYVICVAQKRSTSPDLINEVNKFIDLNQIKSEIER